MYIKSTKMARLSVNINKIATIRNARGGNIPNLLQVAEDIESFGAYGITVHPRPDERHIRYNDVYDLKKILKTEFNIEGNPVGKFVDLVSEIKPTQVTLVPDAENVLTSNQGWDIKNNLKFLQSQISHFKSLGIRTSIFVDADVEQIKWAVETGCDRVELYTESYASMYKENREKAIEPFVLAALEAEKQGIGLNAGHDLSLENIAYFDENIKNLLEVSIGHALISEALYLGLEKTVKLYLDILNK